MNIRRMPPLRNLPFLLLLALCLPILARSEDAFFLGGQPDPAPTSVCVVGNTLYAMTCEGLYAHALSEGRTQKLYDADSLSARSLSTDSLLFRGEGLMLFDPVYQKVWAYDAGQLTQRLDFSGSLPDDFGTRYSCPVYVSGALFLLAIDENASMDEARLIRLRLEDADVQILSVQGVMELCAYRDGDLLALRWLGRMDEAFEVVPIDTKTLSAGKALAMLPGFSDQGVTYDEETGTLYAMTGGALCAWDGAAWQPVRPLPVAYFSFYYGVHGGRYVLAGPRGVGLYDLTAPPEQVTLRIQGTMRTGLDLDFDFMAAHPQIAVSSSSGHVCAEEIHRAVTTGDDSTDIFYVQLSTGLRTLMERGYLEPLSGSEAIRQDNASLYPFISEQLTWNGEIYAVPAELVVWGWHMRAELLQKLGPPRTARELFAQIQAWPAASDAGNVPWITHAYCTTSWSSREAVRYLFDQYARARYDPAQVLSFSDAELRAMLEAARTQLPADETPDDSCDERTPGGLSTGMSTTASGIYYESERVIAPPAVTPDDAPRVPASLYVYVVNPLSRHKDAVLSYLEYAAQNRGVQAQSLMDAGMSEGFLLTDFIELLHRDIEEIEQRLASAAEDERKDLEDRKAQLEAQIEDYIADPSSWTVYEPALRAYHEDILPCLDLGLNPFVEGSGVTHSAVSGNISDLLEQYLAGSLPVDALIEKLNDIAARMFAEGNGL